MGVKEERRGEEYEIDVEKSLKELEREDCGLIHRLICTILSVGYKSDKHEPLC